MKRPIWLIAAGIAVALVAIWFMRRGGQEHVVVNLIDEFPNAKEKRPKPDVFSIIDATIGGDKQQAIFVKESSRLVYSVTILDNAELKVNLGLLEDAYSTPGDGVLFRVLATPANGKQDELLNQVLNPFANSGDRGWHPVSLDLSEYAGERVDLFFNTNASPPGRPGPADTNGDLAVWGSPRIVTR